jgi:hypothetical protein
VLQCEAKTEKEQAMLSSLRLLAVMKANEEEDQLVGYPGVKQISFDLGSIFDTEITAELVGMQLDIPFDQDQLVKLISEKVCDLVNMSLNIETGKITLGTVAEIMEATGEYGGVLVSGEGTPEAREAWHAAGLEVAQSVVPVVKH